MLEIFGCLIIALSMLLVPIVCFLVFSLIYYIICLCFGFTFSWGIALGFFLICLVIRWVISAARGGNNGK